MDCLAVRNLLPDLIDTTAGERNEIEEHLRECRECAAHSVDLLHLHEGLRTLPERRPPAALSARLREMAGREQGYRMNAVHAPSMRHVWSVRLHLLVTNLMRPMAVPFAGGLASAVVLFGSLVPNLGFQRSPGEDIPTPLFQEASIGNVPEFVGKKNPDDTLIEVKIDEQGRLVDFSVPEGQLTSEIGNMILFTQYTPARVFGMPAQGTVMMRRSRVVVKG